MKYCKNRVFEADADQARPDGAARRLMWLALAVPFVLLLALLLGSTTIVGRLPHQLPRETVFAVLRLRLMRSLTGFVVGGALATAGVIFQTILGNPLADPYVLGVSGGAGLGAALVILFLPATLAGLPLGAFTGGALTLLLVYNLSRVEGKVSPYALILSGVIVSALCSSLLMFLVSMAPREGLHNVLWWMLGSLEPDAPPLLGACAGLFVVTTCALWLMAPELDALALGSEAAHYLGVRVRLLVPLALALATFTTASAVALGGLIGFVGLIVPHVCRRLVGGRHRCLIPAAAMLGGSFLALSDTLSRTIMAPRVIPIGVITALFGGPFFLAILNRRRKEGWLL